MSVLQERTGHRANGPRPDTDRKDLPMPSHPTTQRDLDLAWAAGFIDGEGCILVTRGSQRHNGGRSYGARERYYLEMSACQTSVEPLLKLKGLFGGSISEHHTQGNQRRAWRWTAAAACVSRTCRELLPYLVVKRQQAEIALLFQATIQRRANAGLPKHVLEERRRLYQLSVEANRGRPIEVPMPRAPQLSLLA